MDPAAAAPEAYSDAMQRREARLTAERETTKAAPAPLTIRSIGAILGLPDDPGDLILGNGYIERGQRTAVCGMGGIGKSRLMTQLAMMHRTGRPFLGWETKSRHLRWLFLQTENGNRRLKRDFAAMLAAFTPEEQTAITEGVFFHTLETEEDGLLIVTSEANQARIHEAIIASNADIVVVDPLRDFAGDDLNKDTAMTETLRQLRAVVTKGDPRRTLIIVHHAGEGKAAIARATGFDRGAFGRNSKVLKSWARAQFNIAPATPDDNSQILIASGKCNDYEEFPTIAAILNPETLIYEKNEDFDVDAWEESLKADKKPSHSTSVVSDILREAGGGLLKNEAIVRLQRAGVGRDKAWKLVKQAIADGLIEETDFARPGKKSARYLTLR